VQEVKLVYGLKNEETVTIDQVDKGLSCGCVCPACKETLVAKKGKINAHHFAHYNSEDCHAGTETVLHRFCKQLISQSPTFTTPILLYPGTCNVIFEEAKIPIKNVYLEKRLGGIIPDIIIESKTKTLLVEVAVNHRVDEAKFRKMAVENIATIEIYAKSLIRDLYKQGDFLLKGKSFQKAVIERTRYKRWLINPKLEMIKSSIKTNFARKKMIKSFQGDYGSLYYVENCPLQKQVWRGGRNVGESYAKVLDCLKCTFSVINEYEDVVHEIHCAGHLKDDFDALIMETQKHLF
jgi:transposase-like protein